MNFDVTVTHAAGCSRVRLEGEGGAGRILSLLQLLALDSASWNMPAVLVDMRALRTTLDDAGQAQVAEAAARAFAPRRVGILAAPGAMHEAAGVRSFDDDAAAQAWVDAP